VQHLLDLPADRLLVLELQRDVLAQRTLRSLPVRDACGGWTCGSWIGLQRQEAVAGDGLMG
jgi:hypothetical protein